MRPLVGLRPTVLFDGSEHRLAGRDLDDLDHAYAITVHKAQGSAFRTVVIPIVASRLLVRSLIYTALTRGGERVVLVGGRNALRLAVEKSPNSTSRQTGLNEAISERLCCEKRGSKLVRAKERIQDVAATTNTYSARTRSGFPF